MRIEREYGQAERRWKAVLQQRGAGKGSNGVATAAAASLEADHARREARRMTALAHRVHGLEQAAQDREAELARLKTAPLVRPMMRLSAMPSFVAGVHNARTARIAHTAQPTAPLTPLASFLARVCARMTTR